jgi:hypothetical protein
VFSSRGTVRYEERGQGYATSKRLGNSKLSAGLGLAIPAIERPQTCSLDRMATENGDDALLFQIVVLDNPISKL